MSQTALDSFCDAVAAHEATAAVVETAALEGELEEIIDGPAVGAPVPIEGVSLDGLPIALDPTPAELESAAYGVTGARLGLADYGSVAIRADPAGTEPVSLFCDTHVAVVAASTVESSVESAFETLAANVERDRSSVVLATGPSATADMGDLVYGVHGPSNVRVLVLSDR